MISRLLPARLSGAPLACTPASAIPSGDPASARYLIRGTSGETAGVAVDWGLFPDDA